MKQKKNIGHRSCLLTHRGFSFPSFDDYDWGDCADQNRYDYHRLCSKHRRSPVFGDPGRLEVSDRKATGSTPGIDDG
jgi:hypothetical protein